MRKISVGVSLASCLLLAVGGAAVPVHAQGQAALVVRGGTLIDGNGGAPVPNAVVVIEGNHIMAAGPAGQVQVPAGAKIVDATGKWVLPGLIDAKSNWYWQYGEAALHYGMTSAMVSGGRSDVGIAIRDAVKHGVIRGPRLFETYVAIRGRGPDLKRRDTYVPGQGNKFVGSAAETVQWVKNAAEAGADFITFGDGNGPPAWWDAGVKEAQRLHKAIVFRAMGPQTRARQVCAMGDGIIYVHTGNVGSQIAKHPEMWAHYVGLPPDAYSDMDPAKVQPMIRRLLGCHAYLEPDLMAADRGFHKEWKQVQQEDLAFANDPNLPAYYPAFSTKGVIENAKSPDTYLTAEQIKVRAKGFANHMKFLKAYVDAGGKIVAASDNPQTDPGLGLQQEITSFVDDIGLRPMQAIQAATKWTAEAFKQPDLGVIAPGKLADVIVVDADPLQDIKNLRKIDTVILDGKVTDHGYHDWYAGDIFANTHTSYDWAVVGGRPWAAALKKETWRPNVLNGRFNRAGGIDSELSPTPGIESIYPYTVIRGSAATPMTIKGFNFVHGSQVYVAGHAVPVQVVNRTELKATVPAYILDRAGKLPVVVKNPKPLATPIWGDHSNSAYLLVPFEFTTKYSHNKF